MKSLDAKLAAIKADPSSRAFILADARDADMAYGVRAPGPRRYLSAQGARPAQFSPQVWSREEFGYRNLPEFLDIIREVTRQARVDILLMSAYVNDLLTIQEGLFRNSPVTPAARANDTSEVWVARHGAYAAEPSLPFRSAHIDHIQCGAADCDPAKGYPGANLGLYSLTFLNRLEADRAVLLAYKAFREEAERKRFRHFLEVFDPNVDSGIPPERMGEFINDSIIRTLAGVAESARPIFLKIVYHGPRSMEEIVQYDPNMVVGILGGAAGTTYDAFKLLHDAQKHGARAALYGRKINNAEHPLAFIEFLRRITDGEIGPADAVRAYHGVLQAGGIRPRLSLEKDLELTDPTLRRDARGRIQKIGGVIQNNPLATRRPVPAETSVPTAAAWPTLPNGKPDFARMDSSQRYNYNRARLHGHSS